MGSKILNGTTVTHGGVTISKIKSIKGKDGEKWIDITGLSDTTHVYELGKSDPEWTIEVVGVTSIVTGTKNTLTITWADNTNTVTNNAIAAVDKPGAALDGEVTQTIVFKPGEA